jgi:hypothetical protein
MAVLQSTVYQDVHYIHIYGHWVNSAFYRKLYGSRNCCLWKLCEQSLSEVVRGFKIISLIIIVQELRFILLIPPALSFPAPLKRAQHYVSPGIHLTACLKKKV